MKSKSKKLVEFIDQVLDDGDKLTAIRVGWFVAVVGVLPLTVGIIYLVLFGGITKPMAISMFIPSVVITVFWYVCKDRRWFNKIMYF